MKISKFLSLNILAFLIILGIGCSGAGDGGNDPNTLLSRNTTVFGVKVMANPSISNEKWDHAVAILSEYLDNDEDGIVDNADVQTALINHKAILAIVKSQSQIDSLDFNKFGSNRVLTLIEDEMVVTRPITTTFDPSLEEIWHLVTSAGYAFAYPDVFGEERHTEIADAMDEARGRYYKNVPSSYPEGAWYTYQDNGCDYHCQITEYIYWAMTSLLGLQSFDGRYEQIQHEWRLNTPELIQSGDPTVYALLTNPTYKFPTVAPDGHYREN